MARVPILLFNIALAIGLPVIIELVDSDFFTAAEELTVGIVVLIATTSLETLYRVSRLLPAQERALEAWEGRTALDARLAEVRRMFHALDEERRSENDLFFSFLSAKLDDLDRSLRDASAKGEIQIDETMFNVTTWLLDSAFDGSPDCVLRAVHLCEDEDFFFDIHAQRYFKQVYDRVATGSLEGVRRLIVHDKAGQLSGDRTEALIEFHRRNAHYDCRTINRDSFLRITNDYQLHHLVKDFGIYGTSYLYKGLTNRKDEIVGIYSRDRSEIDQFIGCFDTLWESASRPSGTIADADKPMRMKDFVARVT